MSTQKIRILFDANSLMTQRTGVGNYTARLIEQLANDHPEIRLVGYYYNFLGRKPQPTVISAPNLNYRSIICVPGPLVNLLRRWHILIPLELLTLKRADFVFFPNYLGLISLFKTPSASVIHDLTFIDLPAYVSTKNLHDLQNFVPAQIKCSDFVITVSEFSKGRICQEFGVNPSDVLVTPIPPEPVHITEPAIDKTTLSGLGISGKYILTLGTVEPRKNLLNMLNAYESLPQRLQGQYTFVVAGKVGWNCDAELARLDALRREGKNVLHLGYVDDTQRTVLYKNATLFTSASFYEGFGMPALEAMAYGIPTALSDIPVFREVAGSAVIYFNQDNPKDMAGAWQKILCDKPLAQKLSAGGLQRAQSYNWHTVAESLYNKIMQAIGNTRRG